MIIDTNAYLGHYPFMQLRHNTPAGLLSLMDQNCIDRAVVSSLHAVFYRDAHRGNEELRESVRQAPERLIPLATVNPKYAGWEGDFEEAISGWKMKGITLFPEHHGYELTDAHGRAVLQMASRAGIPVALTQRLEDRRQRHSWDQADDLNFRDVVEVAKVHPDLKILLVNWAGLNGKNLTEAGLKGRCLADFARMSVVNRTTVSELIDTAGVEAVAFGSHMPFNYVGPALIKLELLDILAKGDQEKVAWRNAARFLGL